MENVDRMADVVPRIDIATGAAQPIVGKDRESVVIYQMSTKEEQFTEMQSFNFFVGTWNVNGQSPEGSYTPMKFVTTTKHSRKLGRVALCRRGGSRLVRYWLPRA